ncbi:MAG: molybdopterin-binding protein [Shimia sp.]
MRFGPVPISEALGAVLAHSVPLGAGRLRKGLVLEAAHLEALAEAGRVEVWVARMEAGDVPEDAAALRLARALLAGGSGLVLGPAGTGRVNLYAEGGGVLRVDAARVAAINAVDPAITLATAPAWEAYPLPGHDARRGGRMVATVKIIPFAVPGPALAAACAAAPGALSIRPPAIRRVALVQSTHGAPAKGRAALAARLAPFGATLSAGEDVAHDVDAIAVALDAALDTGAELVAILTASATSDVHDVAPAALRAVGGRVERFGMPVDPGNLLFLGDLRGTPVLGLPGCARSPALNGADWVLERLLCGVRVTGADIAAMGVGGLLKDIPTRPRPRGD